MIGRDDFRQLRRSILKVSDKMSNQQIDLLINSIEHQRYKKNFFISNADPGDEQEFCDNQEKPCTTN